MDYKVISFDCYGTLVDWKQGVLKALFSLLDEFQIEMTQEEIFSLFLELDAEIESNSYQSYKKILMDIMSGFSVKLGLNLREDDLLLLSKSLPDWPVYSDTVASLSALKKRYKLAVISNVDNDLFEKTNKKLGIEFDYIITAEDLRSYKPSHNNFIKALEIFDVKKENLLHCAQSYYHDIEPCIQLGIDNVWINRYDEVRSESQFGGMGKEYKSLGDLSGWLIK